MNFPAVIQSDCLPTAPPAQDQNCSDPAYALAHPETCGPAASLVLKPGVLLVCTLGSVQFRAFTDTNGVQEEVISGVLFSTSDDSIALIGVSSGNATGVGPGVATVTATYGTLTATAKLTVLAGDNCCDQIQVGTVLVIDVSKSMTLAFGAGYSQRVDFAKAIAKEYVDHLNAAKDVIGIIAFDSLPVTVEELSGVTTGYDAAIDALTAGVSGTGIGLAVQAAISMLAGSSAAIQNIVLLSDGEDHDAVAADNAAQIAAGFKNQGGLITAIGIRASGAGFNLLNNLATGGFFVNAYPDVAADAIVKANGLRGYVCAGQCADPGGGYEHKPALNYAGFANWDVTTGHVDLIGAGASALYDLLPDNGLYVDMAGSSIAFDGVLTSKTTFNFVPGITYQLSVDIAGNQRADISGLGLRIEIGDGSILTQDVMTPDYTQGFHTYSFNFTVLAPVSGKISFTQLRSGTGHESYGNLIDNVLLSNETDGTIILQDDFDGEGMVFVPLACGTSLIPSFSGASKPQIADPLGGSCGTLTAITSAGGNMTDVTCGGYGHATAYFVVYVTAEGHTRYGFINSIEVNGPNNAVKVTTLTGLDSRVLYKRIYRCGAFNPDSFDSAYYHLRTTIPASQADFIDLLSDAEFIAGFDQTTSLPYDNTTAVAGGYSYAYSYGYECAGYGCLTEPIGVQAPDPSPLPDIEGAYVPPTTYTASKSYTAVCPANTVQAAVTSSIPVLTSDADAAFTLTPSSEQAGYEAYLAFGTSGAWRGTQVGSNYVTLNGLLPTAAIFVAFSLTADATLANKAVDLQLYGSTDGVNYTVIAEFTGQQLSTTAATEFVITHPGSYTNYRLGIRPTGTVGGDIGLSSIKYFVANPAGTGITKSATASSTISQADANAKALAAAQAAAFAELTCVVQYSSTKSYTAQCPAGQFGSPRTMFATQTSLISQADADTLALAAAQVAAQAVLDCMGSNNAAGITINDDAVATPYPSVQYVSGQTGVIVSVTCNVIGFVHADAGDVQMLLVSPSGTKVALMRNAGVGGWPTPSSTFLFSDAGATMLPAVGPLASGTFKPSQYGVASSFPAPAPATPYLTTMAAFAGEDPNGSWALWVRDINALDTGAINNGFVLAFVTA